MKKLFTTIFLALTLFTAASAQHVLEFDGSKAQHVDHGAFFVDATQARNTPVMFDNEFLWEAWIKVAPVTQLGYVVSAGYGGAHAILMGVNSNGKTANVTGNFYVTNDGTCSNLSSVSFTGGSFNVNEWTHIAVGSRANKVVYIYVNGTPVYAQQWIGQRIGYGCNEEWNSGLYIGGSDHLNFYGRIGAVRAWEGYEPYNAGPFIPEVSFRADRAGSNGFVRAAFLADYTQVGNNIADLSNGYKGVKHSGHRQSAIYGLGAGSATRTGFPLPQFVIDTDYPAFRQE